MCYNINTLGGIFMDNLKQKQLIFWDFEKHPWLGKVFKKLSTEEINICLSFIEKNAGCSVDDFDQRVQRMFLDVPNKPKNWTSIMELLTCFGSEWWMACSGQKHTTDLCLNCSKVQWECECSDEEILSATKEVE